MVNVISLFRSEGFDKFFPNIPIIGEPYDLFIECQSYDVYIPVSVHEDRALDIFEEAILKLVRHGLDPVKEPVKDIAEKLCLKDDLAELLTNCLIVKGMLRFDCCITEDGVMALEEQKKMDEITETKTAKIFVIKKTGTILPYIYIGSTFNPIAAESEKGRISFESGSAGNPRTISGVIIHQEPDRKSIESIKPSEKKIRNAIVKYNRLAGNTYPPIIPCPNMQIRCSNSSDTVFFHFQAVIQDGYAKEILFSDGFVWHVDGLENYIEESDRLRREYVKKKRKEASEKAAKDASGNENKDISDKESKDAYDKSITERILSRVLERSKRPIAGPGRRKAESYLKYEKMYREYDSALAELKECVGRIAFYKGYDRAESAYSQVDAVCNTLIGDNSMEASELAKFVSKKKRAMLKNCINMLSWCFFEFFNNDLESQNIKNNYRNWDWDADPEKQLFIGYSDKIGLSGAREFSDLFDITGRMIDAWGKSDTPNLKVGITLLIILANETSDNLVRDELARKIPDLLSFISKLIKYRDDSKDNLTGMTLTWLCGGVGTIAQTLLECGCDFELKPYEEMYIAYDNVMDYIAKMHEFYVRKDDSDKAEEQAVSACKQIDAAYDKLQPDERDSLNEFKKEVVRECIRLVEFCFYYYLMNDPKSGQTVSSFLKRKADENKQILSECADNIGLKDADKYIGLFNNIDDRGLNALYKHSTPELRVCLSMIIARADEDMSCLFRDLAKKAPKLLGFINKLSSKADLGHSADANAIDIKLEWLLENVRSVVQTLLPDCRCNFMLKSADVSKNAVEKASEIMLKGMLSLTKCFGWNLYSSMQKMSDGLISTWLRISPEKHGEQLPKPTVRLNHIYKILQTELSLVNKEFHSEQTFSKKEDALKMPHCQKLPKSFTNIQTEQFKKALAGEGSSLGAEALLYYANAEQDLLEELNKADFVGVIDTVISLRGHNNTVRKSDEELDGLRDQVIELTKIFFGGN